MKWTTIILLLLNVIYFGWEYDRQITNDLINRLPFQKIPGDVQHLSLIKELDSPPRMIKQQGKAGQAAYEEDELFSIGKAEDILVTELPEIDLSGLTASARETYCFTFGPLAEEILAIGLSDWFKSRRAQTSLRHSDKQEEQLFWIYLSPEETMAGALDTISNLKQQGITEYRLINRGNLQNAISLGLYSSQTAVNRRLGELAQKGYKPVVVPYSGEGKIYWLDVLFKADSDLLDKAFKGYPSRYNYIPVDCSKIALLSSKP